MLLLIAAAAVANQPADVAKTTDFGVRVVGGELPRDTGTATRSRPLAGGGKTDLREAAAIGSNWGRVTSTWRSPARNRAVGGVRNSFHLSGRAIDIARRAGVRHRDIEAAFRRAGFSLIESLDEGDHSHFAFGTARAPVLARAAAASAPASGETRWHIVSAPVTAR